ncbi:hypothetical protein EV356DRAFT_498550 [Viridothelium virens]|uniref:Secreted protein n=1 Tax=Viridothelium virens TaxID=1048519 RepID=A0A6A6HF70_VIRVR|nr:hypothetical protein EV356DRAFT_498550 [Viridothelium virens]
MHYYHLLLSLVVVFLAPLSLSLVSRTKKTPGFRHAYSSQSHLIPEEQRLSQCAKSTVNTALVLVLFTRR